MFFFYQCFCAKRPQKGHAFGLLDKTLGHRQYGSTMHGGGGPEFDPLWPKPFCFVVKLPLPLVTTPKDLPSLLHPSNLPVFSSIWRGLWRGLW